MPKRSLLRDLETHFPPDLVDAVLHDFDTLDATICRVGSDESALIDLLDDLLLDMEASVR